MGMDGMDGMGWMMASMGVGHVLALIVFVLAIAALVKYLFFSGRGKDRE